MSLSFLIHPVILALSRHLSVSYRSHFSIYHLALFPVCFSHIIPLFLFRFGFPLFVCLTCHAHTSHTLHGFSSLLLSISLSYFIVFDPTCFTVHSWQYITSPSMTKLFTFPSHHFHCCIHRSACMKEHSIGRFAAYTHLSLTVWCT